MAFQCGFFNSINGDRKYNAEQMNNPYSRIVSNGVFASADDSTDFQVIADSELNIIVKQGQGIFAGKWSILDADLPLVVPTPHVSMSRIDSIIVRIDTSIDVRAGSIEYKQGEPSTNPVPIELENTVNVTEYRLANITVEPNATVITQANIEDCRPTSECGFIHNLLWDSDITATYKQWQAQFDKWFLNLKQTMATSTIISSFTSRYVTTEQDETVIPIGISRYNSVLDILQVYINGLICVENVDYTLDDFNNITLKNGVDAGTEISFICYKSVDGSEAESLVRIVDELYVANEQQQERIEVLESKTDDALWVGANPMGAGQIITPTKKLSECKNGWILVWSDYDVTTGTANNSQVTTTIIPKQIAPTNSFYCILASAIGTTGTVTSCGKSLGVSDTSLTGYEGNTATTDGQDVCLKVIYEF